MKDHARPPVSPDQAEHLANLAGLRIQASKMSSISLRLQAMIDGAALVAALPLRDIEPMTVFRHRP